MVQNGVQNNVRKWKDVDAEMEETVMVRWR
jgi:hypothetical protein